MRACFFKHDELNLRVGLLEKKGNASVLGEGLGPVCFCETQLAKDTTTEMGITCGAWEGWRLISVCSEHTKDMQMMQSSAV